MATFSYTPEFSSSKSNKPSVKKTQFGDGYESRISIGMNSNPDSWDLQFVNRQDTEGDAIISFFEARGGTEAFDWTPPNGTSGKYVCSEWNRTLVKYNLSTITAKFYRVYEP